MIATNLEEAFRRGEDVPESGWRCGVEGAACESWLWCRWFRPVRLRRFVWGSEFNIREYKIRLYDGTDHECFMCWDCGGVPGLYSGIMLRK